MGLPQVELLDFREFVSIIKHMERSPLVSRLFDKYAQPEMGRPLLDEAAFVSMWKREQDEAPNEATLGAFRSLMSAPGKLSESGFHQLIMSDANSATDPQRMSAVSHDMTQPLTSYFIFASSRSYLTGDPIRSVPSVEIIERLLLMGCRAIELDCRDGAGGEPDVFHELSVTKSLRLRTILEAIQLRAFIASAYPLIITLNVFCAPEQQAAAAEMLSSMLGDALVPRLSRGADGALPSPEALRGRVLLKLALPGGANEKGAQKHAHFASEQLGVGSERAAAAPPAASKTGPIHPDLHALAALQSVAVDRYRYMSSSLLPVAG